MGIHIRAPLRRDAMYDTMEDVMAGPDVGAMLENTKARRTASRTAMAEGGSSYNDLHRLISDLMETRKI